MDTAISTDNNTFDVVMHFHLALNNHNVNDIVNLMSNDNVFDNTYPPPDGSRYQGQATIQAYWQKFFHQSPHARFDAEENFTMGERCVLRWVYHWLDAQRQEGHVRGVDIYCVKNRRMVESLSHVKG